MRRKRAITRELHNLIHGNYIPDDLVRKLKTTHIEIYRSRAERTITDAIERGNQNMCDNDRTVQLVRLVDKHKISNAEIHLVCLEEERRFNYNHHLTNATPIVRRDNKGVYIGSGYCAPYSIRYPKKNRSLQTWKKFYEMFPRAAELDHWDGKTSNKMRKSCVKN